MAAILCNGIGKLCSGTCDALGSILSLPCRACGVACDGVTQALKSPFCLYLTVTVGLNIPPVIFAGQALANNNGCNVALQWLSINSFFCIVNVAAAIYISGKVVHDPNDHDEDVVGNDAPYIEATMESNNKSKTSDQQQQQQSSTMKKFWQGPHTAANETRVVKTLSKVGRVRDVLCYDPLVAVYIIIGICYIIWQPMGFSRINQAAGCGGGEEELITRAVSCGFLFISLGATVFGCSVCCLR
eukprot:scaffold306_cov142-Skeletonema_menzelii.AAC.10